jgi:cell division protein FtsW (lipid II flippase)
MQYSRSAGRQQRLAIDPAMVTAVFGLLLAGLVMVGSASLSVAERQTGDPFFYFERQLLSGAARPHGRCGAPRRALSTSGSASRPGS